MLPAFVVPSVDVSVVPIELKVHEEKEMRDKISCINVAEGRDTKSSFS